MDELVLPYFEREEFPVNPLLGERHKLDRVQFRPLQDEFYRPWGWDAQGRPTRESLGGVGLEACYEPMMQDWRARHG